MAAEDVADISGRAYQFDGFGFSGGECRGALSFAICFLDHAHRYRVGGNLDRHVEDESDREDSGRGVGFWWLVFGFWWLVFGFWSLVFDFRF